MKTNLPIEVDPEIMSGAPVFRGNDTNCVSHGEDLPCGTHEECSADWQSAVSQAGSLLRVVRWLADCQSAIQPTASRRYGGPSLALRR